jgi:AmmeMemoRadiSam system protein B
MARVRPPAVAGTFYPAEPDELSSLVRNLLDSALAPGDLVPRALIVPHAGYAYSGPIAASAYAYIRNPRATPVRRVVLMGTNHRGELPGLSASSATGFATPLGVVPVDREAMRLLEGMPQVVLDDPAHSNDHALEVQLPFLQETLTNFAIVPLLVARATPEAVAEVLERLVGGQETLVVVSSDMSHYLDYVSATRKDHGTSQLVLDLDPEQLTPDRACGAHAVAGLLLVARRRGMVARVVDLRNSGDTSGRKDRVVGYGAFVLGDVRAM